MNVPDLYEWMAGEWPVTSKGKPVQARADGQPMKMARDPRKAVAAAAEWRKQNPQATHEIAVKAGNASHRDRDEHGRSVNAVKAGIKGGAVALQKWHDNPQGRQTIIDALHKGRDTWQRANRDKQREFARRAGVASAENRINNTVRSAVDYEGRVVHFQSKAERRYFLLRQAEGVPIRRYRQGRDGVRVVEFDGRVRRYFPDFVELLDNREVLVEVKGGDDMDTVVMHENARRPGRREGDLSRAKRAQHPDIVWKFVGKR